MNTSDYIEYLEDLVHRQNEALQQYSDNEIRRLKNKIRYLSEPGDYVNRSPEDRIIEAQRMLHFELQTKTTYENLYLEYKEKNNQYRAKLLNY